MNGYVEIKGLPMQLALREAEAALRPGDIVFLAIDNPLYRRVAEASGSWTSHVGIAMPGEDGWVVYESSFPRARVGPFSDFVKRTWGTRFAIRRLPRVLTGTELDLLEESAKKRMGRFYGLGFDFDGRRMYCSKFVHRVYREALNTELGRIQTFRELLDENPGVSLNFWRLWYFGRIPWERRTLTPESLYQDEQLFTAFESY